jgi:hypothetical protein
MSGLRELHYAARDPYAGSANLLGATPYLSRKPIRCFGPQRSDLELALVVLYIVYGWPPDEQRNWTVFQEIQKILPTAIHLGEKIYTGGELARLRSQGQPARLAFETLVELVRPGLPHNELSS